MYKATWQGHIRAGLAPMAKASPSGCRAAWLAAAAALPVSHRRWWLERLWCWMAAWAWQCTARLGGGAAGSELTDVLLLLSEADWKPQVIVLPIPVPIFVPVPMHMYCQKVPVPFSMPVPVSDTLHLLVFSYCLGPASLQPSCFSVCPLLLPLLLQQSAEPELPAGAACL